MNNFNLDLKYSLDQRENELFDNFYYKIFKNIKEIELVKNIEIQKQGADKIIKFINGKQLLIDEKKRRVDYGDILLEEWSNYEERKIGWVADTNKKTDYIVYAIMPSKKVYLLPYNLLQMVWVKNYKKWKTTYGVLFAKNPNYRTSNIPIPVNILLDSIRNEMEGVL